MKYQHAIKLSVILTLIYIISLFFINGQGSSHEIELLLTVAAFLFAILIGFYMSRLSDRYNTIREILADGDATWLSLYKTSGFFGKVFSLKISDLIDKYFIIAYDYPIGHEYKHNSKYLFAIYDELIKIKKKNKNNSEIIQIMANLLEKIEQLRNRSAVIQSEKMTKGQWSLLLILATIILYCIFYLHTPDITSQIITVLLSTALSLILLIMRDLQNLKLSGQMLGYESGQELFEFIGKLRYYNNNDIQGGLINIPDKIKKIRIGYHQPGETPNIKIVMNK